MARTTKKSSQSNTRTTGEVNRAKVYVTATFNNTLVTFTDMEGKTLCWGSAGNSGFKGARKSTPFAAATAVEGVAKKAMAMGVKEVEIYIKGPGSGREAALRAVKSAGLRLLMIADVTPIPHNGPRATKPRRV